MTTLLINPFSSFKRSTSGPGMLDQALISPEKSEIMPGIVVQSLASRRLSLWSREGTQVADAQACCQYPLDDESFEDDREIMKRRSPSNVLRLGEMDEHQNLHQPPTVGRTEIGKDPARQRS
jgi:hypothetical protein